MRRTSQLTSLWMASLACLGCFEPTRGGPPAGYEFTAEACRNRFDDDGDRAVDCRDEDCIQRGFCSQIIPLDDILEPEDTAERCTDRIDNDQDGRFDCGDPDCVVILELCCVLEFDDASCSNGVDDDGNGFADCADAGCSRNALVSVCSNETICDDFVDNDGDRRRDCDDSDCARAGRCIPGGEEHCGDGDDDRDGRADCDDRDCYGDPRCAGPEDSLVRCVDGNDNDGSGQADCGDAMCQALQGDAAVVFEAYCAARTGPETTSERCIDGVDNDANGFADCRDRNCCAPGMFTGGVCDGYLDATVQTYCDALPVENRAALCVDGVDNDRNGFTDCRDRNCCAMGMFMGGVCRGYLDASVQSYCDARVENTADSCSDGVDNDANGFTDCGDFSCTMASRGATPEAIARCATEEHVGTCIDGQDNDRDGARDCYDEGCCMPGAFANGLCSTYAADPIRAFCERAENSIERCSDGLDNDGNGFADCGDFSCSRSPDEDLARYCSTQGERTYTRCTDGLDNDGNGFSDCEDFSCRDVVERLVAPNATTGQPEPTGQLRSPCRESVGSSPEWERRNCQDGRDNDGDGFADCDDWDCNWNPNTRSLCFVSRIVPLEAVGADRDAERAACQDGRDTDEDGFADCDDWDCSENPNTSDLCSGRPSIQRPRVCG